MKTLYSNYLLAIISLLFSFGMIFTPPSNTYAADNGCWITKDDCPAGPIAGLEFDRGTDRTHLNVGDEVTCYYGPDVNKDSIQIEYTCYNNAAEAQLEYEYATYQKERPKTTNSALFGKTRKIDDCNLVSANSGGCRGYVVIDRYLAKIKGKYPWDEKIENQTQMHEKADAEAMKRVEAGKIAAATFAPTGTKPGKQIKGRAYALDFLGLEQPIPYAKIELDLGGEKYTDTTDMDGEYSFDLYTDTVVGKITLTLAGYHDDVNVFEVADESTSVEAVKIWRDINLNQDTNFIIDVMPSSEYQSTASKAHLRALADHYYHLSQAMDFARLILMADVSQLKGNDILPITLFAYSRGADHIKSTYYGQEHGTINLSTKDSHYNAPDSPLSIFHEFGHHIMYTQFTPVLWDQELESNMSTNHGGIINSNTADSYAEGYATFLAVLMAQEYGHAYPHPHEPSPVVFGRNWEVNYKAWDMEGTLSREEFAVVGLLYDLIDKYSDKNDNVQMEFSDLWKIMQDEKVQTVKDLYDALIKVEAQAKVDALFIDHGFFWDKQEGDKQLNNKATYTNAEGETCEVKSIEPALDINKDGHIETHTEAWMDYSNWHQYPCEPTFDEGDQVGFTGSYQTTERKTFANLPNQFMEVDNGTYTLNYTFPEDPDYNYTLTYEVTNNLMPVVFPPTRYNASVDIANNNDENQYLVLSTEEYNQAISDTADQETFRSERTEKSSDGSIPFWAWFALALVLVAFIKTKIKK